MGIRGAILILLAVAMTFAPGCRTTVTPPPGFTAASGIVGGRIEFPVEMSPEAQYALLRWYIMEEGAATAQYEPSSMAVATNACNALQAHFQSIFLTTVLQKYPLFITASKQFGVEVHPRSLGERQDWRELQEMLQQVSAAVSTPGEVRVPVAECLEYLRFERPQLTQRFREWSQEHATLVVPPPTGHGVLEVLRQCLRAVTLKEQLSLAVEKSAALLKGGQIAAAMAELDRLEPQVAGKGNPLAIIGDEKSVPAFREYRQEMNHQAISRTLQLLEEKVSAQKDDLAALEEFYAVAYGEWLSDGRFAQSLTKYAQPLTTLAEKLCHQRLALWKKSLLQHGQKGAYWQMWEECRRMLEMLPAEGEAPQGAVAKGKSPLRLYGYFPQQLKYLRSELQGVLQGELPQALTQCVEISRSAVENTRRPGVAFAALWMGEELSTTAWGEASHFPPQVQEQLGQLQSLVKEARRQLVGILAQRTLVVNDFASTAPMLGKTLARDLAFEVQQLFEQVGVSRFCKVATTPVKNAAWLIEEGIIAQYQSVESPEQRRSREVRCLGQMRVEANPYYNTASELQAAGEDAMRSRSLERYVQDEIRRIVHQVEYTRQAHIRFFFQLNGQGDKRRIECNEFYTRSFLVEDSHPVEDAQVVRQHISYDQRQVLPPTPAPTLQRQRVWSAGEVLDFARNDTMKIGALQILSAMLEMPLMAERRALELAANGNPLPALEVLGSLSQVLQFVDWSHLPPAKDSPKHQQLHQELQRHRQSLQQLQQRLPRIACPIFEAAMQQRQQLLKRLPDNN